MICSNCKDYGNVKHIIDTLTSSPVSGNFNREDYFILNNMSNFHCSKCGCLIHAGKYYIADYNTQEIYDIIGTEVARLVMNEIEACSDCDYGQSMIELHHNIEKTYDEKDEDPEAIFNSFNFSTTLGELIYELSNIDNDFYKYIIPKISCPHCKSGSGENYDDKTDYGEWNEDTIVYTRTDIDKFNKAFYGD